MLRENLALCRPFAGTVVPVSGRGLAFLRSELSRFEEFWAPPPTPQTSVSRKPPLHTLPVVTSRVAVCEPAGVVRPEDWLPADKAARFAAWEEHVTPATLESSLPRPCLMVSPSEEHSLRRLLTRSGMAVLVEESRIPRRPGGGLLLGGLFAVPHKASTDRLIFDRRPQNAEEARLGWAALPLGAQLSRLVLGRGSAVRASGDDLRTYFYALRSAKGVEVRNCFGRAIRGSEAAELGGSPSCSYRLGLAVEGMGDLNAVDVAHTTHACLLEKFGLMDPEHVLIYGHAFPRGRIIEILYIDDHIVVCICRKQELLSPLGIDRDMVFKSHEAYEAAKLDRAPEKAFGFGLDRGEGAPRHADPNFVALGTDVRDSPGLAGAPLSRERSL